MKIKISEIILPAAGLAFALLVLCMQPVSGEVVVSAIVQQNLEQAFKRAFNDPAEFRDSGVFQLLGYTSSEIEQIGKITPRPASITVEADYIEQENVYKNIRVICEKVLYYNLTIDRVTFEFPDCRLSSEDLAEGRLRFISSKQIKLKTEVSADDIARVFDLVARARRLRNLRIELEQDRAKVNGRVRRGLFTVDFSIVGFTELVDAKTVVFSCQRMWLNRVALPRNVINALFRGVNPVFNARKTWLNLNIASINIRRGYVETIATIDRRKS